MLGAIQMDSDLAEQDLDILVDAKLTMRQQCVLVAKRLTLSWAT